MRWLALIFIAGLLSGCANQVERNTLTGAAIGAGVGALIGSASGPGGTGIGAVVGGVAGGTIGYLVRPEGCFILNRRGEVWRVPCDGRRIAADACYMGNEIIGYRQVSCPARYR